MSFERAQLVLWLVGAGLWAGGGCGSRSSTDAAIDFGRATDDGGLAGGAAVGRCRAPSCADCGSCLDGCLCATGDRGYCDEACGRPAGCVAPGCGGCDTCLDACFCATGDADRCVSECRGGSIGGGSSTGGVPSTGARPGVAGGAALYCNPDLRCDPSPPLDGLRLEACCRSRFECGLDATPLGADPVSACLPRFADGFFDPSCQSLPGPAGTYLGGCCTPQGLCGLDLSSFDLGCVENGMATPLPSRPCGYGAGGYGYGVGGYGYGVGGYGYGVGGYGATYGPGGAYGYGGSPPYAYYDAGPPYGYGGYGPDPVAQCVEQSRTECEACACNACFTDVTTCFGDPGCPEVLQCANLTGCTGADCYQPGTCQAVIDRYGGIGSMSTQLAIPLFQCLQSAGCPCGFAGP